MSVHPQKAISELELIQQCRAGDETAFRMMVMSHEQLVRRTVIGMVGETPRADDIAQEVFIRFFQSMNKFRGESKLSTYLTRIAVNLSLNELKKQQRKNRWLTIVKKGAPEMSVEDVSANPEKIETKELVWKALKILEPEFRAVVVLRLLDGYSVKETAEILQLPEGTVGSRLARGQKKLKSILEKIL